jgi:hypothetical protein
VRQKKKLWTQDEIDLVIDLHKTTPYSEIGNILKRSRVAITHKVKELGLSNPLPRPIETATIDEPLPSVTQQLTLGVVISSLPKLARPIKDILTEKVETFKANKAHYDQKKSGVTITIPDKGPYAILCCGDPHVDDDGTDIEKMIEDLEAIKSNDHVYGINIGDLTNNWIRALGHLYGRQHGTADEAIELMEWLITYVPWLIVILGNHDKWASTAATLCQKHKILGVDHGIVAKLICGSSEVIFDIRHYHKGHSMYNPSHGPLKKNFRGSKADVTIGGHIHSSGFTLTRNGYSGVLGRSITLASYKKYDDYADAGDFEASYISPSVMVVVNTMAESDIEKVNIFHSIDDGLIYLQALRSKYKATKG